MIQHTRINLLLLKEKSMSVEESVGILKARRQALIQEFLITVMPFIRSRDEIRNIYGKAIEELSLSLGREGKDNIESITFAAKRDMSVEITERSIWGLRYRDVVTYETAVRMPDERGYDYFSTTQHLEECINGFEKILESMLELAAFESKLKRLGDEILKTTRKTRVLEERVLPDLKNKIKAISQYLGERERESYYRLKVFKNRNKI
jgi:V/A-type H+-transporting ATPase subunit D